MGSKSANKVIRNLEYYDLQKRFDELYEQGLQQKSFVKLYELIVCEENILLAYSNIKTNTGSQTAGIDGRTIKDIEKLTTQQLITIVRKKLSFYKPNGV